MVADSLRGDHLGVLGYTRDTTPRLSARTELIARPGVASGVSTAVSLPLILNAIREPGQSHEIRDLSTNLFRLAKEAGFKTYWISSQESKLLNDVGSRYIDVSITREDEPERFLTQGDSAVLSVLDQQHWPEKTFTVILLRTAHAPYEANYAHDREHFARWPDDTALPRTERLRNAYDNSVLYFDSLVDQIITRFDKLSGPRHLIVTGDHGQLLGQRGLWGHNILEPEVASVPVLALGRDASPAATRSCAIPAGSAISKWPAGWPRKSAIALTSRARSPTCITSRARTSTAAIPSRKSTKARPWSSRRSCRSATSCRCARRKNRPALSAGPPPAARLPAPAPA